MSKNLIFSENLYIGESIDIQKLDKLKKSLIEAPLFTKVFLIMISTNPRDQLDIIESKYLSFQFFNTHPVRIVGLAKTNGEAVSLVQKILQDCLENRNDADMKAFLLDKN